MIFLEHIVTGYHNYHTGQRSCQGRKDKAEFDAAKRRFICKHPGNWTDSCFIFSASCQVFIVLLTEIVDQRPLAQIQLFQADSAISLERKNHNHHNRCHVDDEKHIGINMCHHIPDRVVDLLFLQFCLCLGHREVMSPPFISGEYCEQNYRKHCQNNGQQCRTCLWESLICTWRSGKAHDLRVDGVIPQQRRSRHSTEAGNERHNR